MNGKFSKTENTLEHGICKAPYSTEGVKKSSTHLQSIILQNVIDKEVRQVQKSMVYLK